MNGADWKKLDEIYQTASVNLDQLLAQGNLARPDVPTKCAFWHVINNMSGLVAFAEDPDDPMVQKGLNIISRYFALMARHPEFRAEQLDESRAGELTQEITDYGGIEKYVHSMESRYSP